MFRELLEAISLGLEERKIPYMIIGGQAVLIYGEPRLTRDIDVTLGVGPDGLAAIIEFVKSRSWRVLVDSPSAFVKKTMVLPCDDPPSGIRIDFIFSHSEYERQAMERVRRITVGQAAVRFAAPEDVIVHKIVAGRPRDLEDGRSILLKNPSLDRAYIRRWLAEFDRSLEGGYLERFEQLTGSAS